MTDTSEQLAPCPFCGGAPTIGYNPRQPDDITCENDECPVIVETDVGAFGDAVKIWNTRARTPRQLDAEVVARVQEAMTAPAVRMISWNERGWDQHVPDSGHAGAFEITSAMTRGGLKALHESGWISLPSPSDAALVNLVLRGALSAQPRRRVATK